MNFSETSIRTVNVPKTKIDNIKTKIDSLIFFAKPLREKEFIKKIEMALPAKKTIAKSHKAVDNTKKLWLKLILFFSCIYLKIESSKEFVNQFLNLVWLHYILDK